MSVTRAGLTPLVVLLALGAMLGEARAQQKPPQPAPAPAPVAAPVAAAVPAPAATASPGLSILLVDQQSLLTESKAAKMVLHQVEQKRAEYTKEFSREEAQLRHERDTLQRQQASLSSEALRKKGQEFEQKVNELNRSVQAKGEALKRSYAEALEKIHDAMLKIVAQIAKERKANLVFQRGDVILFGQGFDVTDQVLQKLNEQLPTLTVNFVVPAASGASPGHPAAAETASKPSHRKK
ncbi:MAG TPA: OmpH family outer membrane protein [Stellaceae bacterium]|nr:OmpH family outer membrane protein [Stellaceae bacterium]